MVDRWIVVVLCAAGCGRVKFAPRPGDAAPDTDADSGDALVTFCTGVQARFCEDFDRGTLGAQWDGSAVASGGALKLDTSMPSSSPNALYAGSPLGGPYGAAVTLRRDLAPAFVHGTIDVDVRVDSDGDPGTRMIAARVVLGTNCVGIGTHPNGSEIVECANGTQYLRPASMKIPFATWTHVKLDVDLSSSPGTATMSFDGTVVVTTPLDPSTVSAAPRLEAGLPWIENTSTLWSVDVDNLVFSY